MAKREASKAAAKATQVAAIEQPATQRETATAPKAKQYDPAKDPSFLDAKLRAQGGKRINQLHLTGEGHSWRGVRLQDLSTPKRREAENQAAQIVGKDGTLMELRNETMVQVLQRMVVEVTTEPVADASNGEAKWMATPLAMLAQPAEWDRLFTSRDTQALERVYNRRHEMSMDEVDLLSGKLRPVATGD